MKPWLVLVGLGLVGCVPAQTPEQVAAAAEVAAYHPPPEPAKMGSISGQLDGKAVAWETYDFSVGAYDASAWVGFADDVQTLHLRGLPHGQPHSEIGVILISGDILAARKPGALANVKVLMPFGRNADGPGLSSMGQTATLQIERIDAPQVKDSGYGKVAGRVTATLCPIAGAKGACQDFIARFDTDVQFDATHYVTAQ